MSEMDTGTNMESTGIDSAGMGATKKEGKGMMIGMIACAVLAVAGIGFGVYEMTEANKAKTQIADLRVEIKKEDGTTATIDTSKIETSTENGTTIVITDDILDASALAIPEMGIAIKNLDQAGKINQYTFSRQAQSPSSPESTFEILSYDGVPDVGTDSIGAVSGAIIYKYNADYFFDHETTCDVEVGKIGDYNYCIAKKHAESPYAEMEEWNTWAESNIEKLLKVISNPDNYIAL